MQKLSFIFYILLIYAGVLLLTTSCQKEELHPGSFSLENEKLPLLATVANKPKSILLAQHPALGNYLVDQDGRTLYILARDVSGNSSCLTRCLGQWPVFGSKHVKVSRELNASDFATITRPDGRVQVTFKGWPLYYYSGDTQPGELNGEGLNENAQVAKPDYTLVLAKQPLEAFGGAVTQYFTNAQGRTLYFFLQDPDNGSSCYDECLNTWPAFTDTENLVVPSLADATKFSVITRADGKKQLAYLGMPLYYFAQDTKRAEAKGQLIEHWTVAHTNWE